MALIKKGLFVHTKPLALIFKVTFKNAMRENNHFHKIVPSVWEERWVVYSRSGGERQRAEQSFSLHDL